MKNAKIHFARKYPFYLKKKKPFGAFSFLVTIKAYAKMNPQTGMSVDLVQLDRIAKKIFQLSNKASKDQTLLGSLETYVDQLKSNLKVQKIQLISVHFEECRGLSYLFVKNKVLTGRQDFAENKQGDLFEVNSFFNQKNELVQMSLYDFKNRMEEQFLYFKETDPSVWR